MTLFNRLVIVAFILIGILVIYNSLYGTTDEGKKDMPVVSKTAGEPDRKFSILFIGGSYTSTNNLPKMIADIASSDPDNRTELTLKSITEDDKTLAQLWENGDIRDAIASQHWDFVVLQNPPEWALSPDVVSSTGKAAPLFAQAIETAGGMPVLYLTWMYEPGTHWYREEADKLQSADNMLSQLHYATSELATHINAGEVSAGDCWKYMLDNGGGLHLYQDDNAHPTPSGTYLVALMFYHYFTGRPIDKVGYLPAGAYEAEGQAIKSLLPHCPMY